MLGHQRRAPSCVQKKAASARRGRTTRSFPRRTTAGSRLRCVLTAMKRASNGAVGRFDREIALMVLKRREQHLARERQEARLKLSGDGHRPLHQRRDFPPGAAPR